MGSARLLLGVVFSMFSAELKKFRKAADKPAIGKLGWSKFVQVRFQAGRRTLD
jgi:hypothetical protein